ncbi:C40 family peptidase [Shewanella sp. JM162201]|uniref:C40 family peptidase n=2 Tax=Shewanella jiangmenensis TaxID=2837387 RepID=A0ABS5V8Y3_9GAMM|nr:C40 family peptidase [Shewanella jiangmenensis]
MLLALWLAACSSKPEPEPAPPPVAVATPLSEPRLLTLFKQWEGVPYRLGGMSKRGIDCSGFTLMVYRDLAGVSLPRTVNEQLTGGKAVSRGQQRPGDLIFFKTGRNNRHVGVSLGGDRFVHASTSSGVIISSLSNSYWQQKFWQIRRYAD